MKRTVDPRTLAPEALLTIKQAAQLMNVSIFYLKERMARGEIATVPWGRTGDLRIPRKALMVWTDEQIVRHRAEYGNIARMIATRPGRR
jgi:excisionase family DNA binding protein